MVIVPKIGRSKYLVIGEGYAGDDSTEPFSTDGGTLLRACMAEAMVSPSYIEIRRNDKDSEEDLAAGTKRITDIISSIDGLKGVFLLGRGTAQLLVPNFIKGKSVAGLNKMLFVKSAEINASVAVLYHPKFILKEMKDDPVVGETYTNRITTLVSGAANPPYDVSVNPNISFDEFLDVLDMIKTTGYSGLIGLDFETNAEELFHERFEISLFSIAIQTGPQEAISWWIDVTGNETEHQLQRLRDWMCEYQDQVIAFNAPFEINVLRTWIGDTYEIQDAMVTITMHSARSSLKEAVRRFLQADFWESDTHHWLDRYEAIFKQIQKKQVKQPELMSQFISGEINFDEYRLEPESGKKKDDTRDMWLIETYDALVEELGESEAKRGISKFPYQWAAVPYEILGEYCCYDSAYGIFLHQKLIGGMESAYSVYIHHPWLAATFMANGVRWDDVEASKEEAIYLREMVETLTELTQMINLSPDQKMKAIDIQNWDLPHTKIWYTEKRRDERRKQITNEAERHEELKSVFNPNSNMDSSRQLFWKRYLTEEVEMATALYAVIGQLRLADVWDRLLIEMSKDFVFTASEDDKPGEYERAFCRSQPVSDTMEWLVNKFQNGCATDPEARAAIEHALADGVTTYKESFTGRFAQEIMGAQYEILTTFFGCNIDKPETWTPEFRMLFLLRKYKKINKMLTTYVNGGVGRGNVHLARLNPDNAYEPPTRIMPYREIPSDYVMKDNEILVLNTDFNSLSAITTRWSAGYHTIPGGASIRRALIPKTDTQIWVHCDYSQAELVILAFFSQDPAMLQVFLTGGDMHRYIASVVFDIPEDQITSEQRRSAKAVSFGIIYGKSVENLAIDMAGGDVAKAQGFMDVFFERFPGIRVWMDERLVELEDKSAVSTLFGNVIEIDQTKTRGNEAKRQAVNYPIQGTASTIAGTSMDLLRQYCLEIGMPESPMSFTHDAEESLTEIDSIFDYMDTMILKMQTEPYERMGMPMRIDFELGVGSYHLCEVEDLQRSETGYKFELSGPNEAVTLLVKKFQDKSRWEVIKNEVVKSKEVYVSWDEMFTTKSAYKSGEMGWGSTFLKVTHDIELREIV